MALYLGKSKQKIKLGNNKAVSLNIYVPNEPLSNILKSFDNYILKDKNGLFLIPKGSE